MFNHKNILNNKILVNDLGIFLGSQKIEWNEIVGIREFSNEILRKIHYRFPFLQLLLMNGKIIRISNLRNFSLNGNKSSYDDVSKYIRGKAKNINPDLNDWFEWRFFLPVAIAQMIAIPFGFMLNNSFEKAMMFILIISVVAIPIGWIWERKSRVNKIKKIICHSG